MGKSSGSRAYDKGFKAGYGKPNKKKSAPRSNSGGGGGSSSRPVTNRQHSREFHAERPNYPQGPATVDVKVVFREDGNTDTYFGGVGKADGPGHGHVATSPNGQTIYARESSNNGGRTYVDRP